MLLEEADFCGNSKIERDGSIHDGNVHTISGLIKARHSPERKIRYFWIPSEDNLQF
jgi:hypothetical protein